jgi:hypothetical protein
MPCVCEFYGVAIYFYYNDHAPPHFHAEYAEFEAKFLIDTLELFEGTLPRRARTLVIEWASEHRLELQQNWERARNGEPLIQIESLE